MLVKGRRRAGSSGGWRAEWSGLTCMHIEILASIQSSPRIVPPRMQPYRSSQYISENSSFSSGWEESDRSSEALSSCSCSPGLVSAPDA